MGSPDTSIPRQEGTYPVKATKWRPALKIGSLELYSAGRFSAPRCPALDSGAPAPPGPPRFGRPFHGRDASLTSFRGARPLSRDRFARGSYEEVAARVLLSRGRCWASRLR